MGTSHRRRGMALDGIGIGTGTGIDRRSALKVFGAAAAAPLLGEPIFGLPGYHPQVPAVEADRRWRPRFFEPAEIATVEEIAEIIVPETESPGARSALVHQHIDFTLSRDRDDSDRVLQVRRGLEWVDRRSRELHGAVFVQLGTEDQNALLLRLSVPDSAEDAAGVELFRHLKALTIRGYYRSEAGMHDELGYEGGRYLRRFEGCTHPEHRDWEPSPPEEPSSPEEKG